MSKLVDSHITVRPFIPKLLPGLIKVETTIDDPEACSVVGRAITTLRQVGRVPEGDGSDLPPLKVAESKQLSQSLAEIYEKLGSNIPVASASMSYASHLAANLVVNAQNFEWVVRSANEDSDEAEALEDEEEMKLALARAMLFRADILLLDEPTNHLDVVNIAWLENYLNNLKTCTSSKLL